MDPYEKRLTWAVGIVAAIPLVGIALLALSGCSVIKPAVAAIWTAPSDPVTGVPVADPTGAGINILATMLLPFLPWATTALGALQIWRQRRRIAAQNTLQSVIVEAVQIVRGLGPQYKTAYAETVKQVLSRYELTAEQYTAAIDAIKEKLGLEPIPADSEPPSPSSAPLPQS